MHWCNWALLFVHSTAAFFPLKRLLWCGARSTATRPTAPSWVRFLEDSWGTSSSTWSRPTSSWKRFTRWASFRTTSSWMLWPIKWAFEGCCSNHYFRWQLRNGHFSIEWNVFCIFTVVLKLFLIAFRPTQVPWSPSSWAILQTRQERFEIHLDGKKMASSYRADFPDKYLGYFCVHSIYWPWQWNGDIKL